MRGELTTDSKKIESSPAVESDEGDPGFELIQMQQNNITDKIEKSFPLGPTVETFHLQ